MTAIIKSDAEVIVNGKSIINPRPFIARDARRNRQSGCLEFTLNGQAAYVMEARDYRADRCPTCAGEGDCPDCEVL